MKKLIHLRVFNNYYFNLFFYITVAIVATTFLLSTIFYINSKNITSAQIYSYVDSNLYQLSKNIEKMNSSVRNLCVMVYSDRFLKKFFFNTNPSDIDIIDGLAQLENYRFVTNTVSSIYLFNNNTKTFYIATKDYTNLISSKSEFFDKNIGGILDNYKYGKTLIPIPRIIPADEGYTGKSELSHGYYGYSYVFFDSFNDQFYNSAVVVNIPENSLTMTIKNMDNTFKSTTLIIDKDGRLVVNTDRQHMGTDISQENYIARILKAENTKGYFIDKVYGVKSYIAYSSPDGIGWRYISITPYEEITKKVNNMRNKIVLIGLSILFVGIILSVLISRKLYKPVKRMVSKINVLESEKRDSFYTIRQEALREIITGFNKMDTKKLGERLEKLCITLDMESKILVVLFTIDHYSEFCRKYSVEDRSLLKFAAMNIASELFSAEYPNEIADMGDKHILLLAFIHTSAFDSSSPEFENLLRSIQDVTSDCIDVSTSITVSSLGDSMEEVTFLYCQVMENSFHKLFYGDKCIIYSDRIDALKENDFEYPAQKEKNLREYLMLGNTEEAKNKYIEIVEYISQYPYSAVNLTFSHLFFTIRTSLNTLQKNNFWEAIYDFSRVLPSLNEFDSIEDINKYFFEIFQNIGNMLDQKKNTKYEELVSKVTALIRSEYMNQSLSIDMIADKLGYTSNYIGRLYKKITGNAISDIINDTRMKKAKELLTDTDMLIAKISELTGFASNGYFYKAFKKENGITPNEYRKNFCELHRL